MSKEPIFTAHNQESEAHRIQRLREVWDQAVARAANYGNHILHERVRELRDYKGVLTVKWVSAPAAGEKEFFASAWSGACEPPGNVEHEVA